MPEENRSTLSHYGNFNRDIFHMSTRSRSAWNASLASWEKPASDHEESKIERAANMVRASAACSDWITSQGVRVLPQGSYFNNTNVRLDADMDLRALHPLKHFLYAPGVVQQYADQALEVKRSGLTFEEVAWRMRAELAVELGRTFGDANVDLTGDKAIRVKELPGSRAKVDIVPSFELRYVEWNSATQQYCVTNGVSILARSGRYTFNFPDQHRTNGISKREATGHRFKKIVRMLKRMRTELPEIAQKTCPSFLVECLVYRVEDGYFLIEEDDRYGRLWRIVRRLEELLSDVQWCERALEISDAKLLFGAHQSWSKEHAATFIKAARCALEA